MSHTNVKTTTKNQRGRGRGGKGRNQQNRNSNPRNNFYNYSHPNTFPSECLVDGENWEFVNYPGNSQPNRGRGRPIANKQPNRGQENFNDFRNKNFNGGHSSRSYSSSNMPSSVHGNGDLPRQGVQIPNGNDPFRQPSHAQNPIFVDLLKERFNSILPQSRLLNSSVAGASMQADDLSAYEAPTLMQASPSSSQNTCDDENKTFASISNNIGHGFRNRSSNHKKSVDHRDKTDINQLSSSSGSHNKRSLSNSSLAGKNINYVSWQPDGSKSNRSDNSSENIDRQLSGSQQSKRSMATTPNDSKFKTETSADRRSRISGVLNSNGFKVRQLKNDAGQNKTNEGNSPAPASSNTIGTDFLSQLNKFNSDKSSPGPNFLRSTNTNNNLLSELSKQLEDFHNIFGSQIPIGTRQQGPRTDQQKESEVLPNMNKSNPPPSNTQGLTQGAVAGSLHFNINRPVADPNQRAPTRSEALQRIQLEYDLKAAEHEAKEREKEAKKREQYFARHKHVDLGYRLNEQYLDNPTRHAPFLASQEEVRQRQQNQLRLDAMLNQNLDKERLDREKKKEEDKQRKWLKKHEHIDAGYRLGGGETQGTPQHPRTSGSTVKSDFELPRPQEAQISSELLLEGETIEDALIRQQEQLLLESLIYNEMFKDDDKKKEEGSVKDEGNLKKRESGSSVNKNACIDEGYLDEAAGYGGFPSLLDGESVDYDVLISQQEQILLEAKRNKEQKGGINRGEGDEAKETESMIEKKNEKKIKIPPCLANSREQAAIPKANQNLLRAGSVLNNTISTDLAAAGLTTNGAGTAQSVEKQGINMNEEPQLSNLNQEEEEDLEKEKQRLLARLALLMSKSSKPTVVQEPKPLQSSKPSEVLKPIKPASCVLKNPTSGPVLVLRASEDDLNKALVQRLEVQDEMDRLGTSAVYKPQVEQKPLYSNNKYEWKPQTEKTQAKGAIPKQNSAPAPVFKPAIPSNTPSKPEEPVIDHQAEMRAARLKMQQKYEENLKKKQENSPMQAQ